MAYRRNRTNKHHDLTMMMMKSATGTSESTQRSAITTATRILYKVLLTVAVVSHLSNSVTASNANSPTLFGTDSRHGLTATLRKILPNLSGRTHPLHNAKGCSVYDLVAGQPVFAVTTPYGNTYMNMERMTNVESKQDIRRNTKTGQVTVMPDGETRMIAVLYTDIGEAESMRNQLSQLDAMKKSDIRITSFSMTKALSQASNTGQGLPTGYPVDALTGNLDDNNGALRYKLMPSKKQLYYASRCYGAERVGLFYPDTNAGTCLSGNSAIATKNLEILTDGPPKLLSTASKETAPDRLSTKHMVGHTGIPVFHAKHVVLDSPSLWKRVLSGTVSARPRTPLFMNYEDCVHATNHDDVEIEVFNLWDVLTSMDRDYQIRSNRRQSAPSPNSKRWYHALQDHVRNAMASSSSISLPPNVQTLSDIVFIPNSECVQHKHRISKHGNGKARLPRMR